MPIERAAGGASLIDVLERVLDKGIVIDAWAHVSLVGVDVLGDDHSVVVVHATTNTTAGRRRKLSRPRL
jgi:hypothetical protein